MKTSSTIAVSLTLLAIMGGIVWYSYSREGAPLTAGPQIPTEIPYQSPYQSRSRAPTPVVQPIPEPAPAQTTAPKFAPQSAPSQAPLTQSFTVNGNDSGADLTTITVTAGVPVTIIFGADGDGTYHGGLDFRSSVVNTGTIAPGSTKSVSFTATKSFAFTPYWPATNIAKPYRIKVIVQ